MCTVCWLTDVEYDILWLKSLEVWLFGPENSKELKHNQLRAGCVRDNEGTGTGAVVFESTGVGVAVAPVTEGLE